MTAFAEFVSAPGVPANPSAFAVISSATEVDERKFVAEASRQGGSLTGAEPWLEFMLLDAISLFPTGDPVEAFLRDSHQGNVVRSTTDVRQETILSGATITRFTRFEQDDRGEFSYDAVYIPHERAQCAGLSGCEGIIIRIAKAGRTSLQEPTNNDPIGGRDYAREAFEFVFRSFAVVE